LKKSFLFTSKLTKQSPNHLVSMILPLPVISPLPHLDLVIWAPPQLHTSNGADLVLPVILGFPETHPPGNPLSQISPLLSVQFQLPSQNHPNPYLHCLSLTHALLAHAPPPPADLRPNLPSPPLSSRKKQKQRDFSLSEVFVEQVVCV
jgi:hypothetical protein